MTIFLDMDETLVRTYFNPPEQVKILVGEWGLNNAHRAEIMGHQVHIIKRPHAEEFIAECRKLAPTHILTAGGTKFQMNVLEQVGLINEVHRVYGIDSYQIVPRNPKSILVDNMPYNSQIVMEKLIAIGSGIYIPVRDWHGSDPDDNELMENVLPKIKQLVK